MFMPKFHCQLNPIDHVWCHAKHYTHTHCDHPFPIIDTTLYPMTVDLIKNILETLGLATYTKELIGREIH